MKKTDRLSLFIFRRDLRIHDNTALLQALKTDSRVIPAFIFDPVQGENNPYFSTYGFTFLLESLIELNLSLREIGSQLYVFKGEPLAVIQDLASNLAIDSIYFNRDYTPFARKRDRSIFEYAKSVGISVHQFPDALLNEPENVLKVDGTPYTVFTPYYKRNSLIAVRNSEMLTRKNLYNGVIYSSNTSLLQDLLKLQCDCSVIKGGRVAALNILEQIKSLEKYSNNRDFPAIHGTSLLSAHLKFGTLSVREVYHTISENLGISHPILRQLYWRDFFSHITYHFPYVFGAPFKKEYNTIRWSKNEDFFKRWCQGKTGFPIVDAGMRELNQTGYMHNRVRMIVASFLVKDLHINWLKGEKYFATKLVDYDPAVNNGNWQWAASTGCDAQPYFRIFNPWLQQAKFDSQCIYIKKWVPELNSLAPKAIHKLSGMNQNLPNGYPLPIVNHSAASSIARQMFEDLKEVNEE